MNSMMPDAPRLGDDQEQTSPEERLLTPNEVSQMFRVAPKTVLRWARSGKLTRIKTPGGHCRFAEADVRALLKRPIDESAEGVPA